MKTQNIIVEKSFSFSLSVIALYKKLIEVHEYVLSKQVLRSATSIGANVEEDHLRALAREAFDHAFADAGAAAGNEDALALQARVDGARVGLIGHGKVTPKFYKRPRAARLRINSRTPKVHEGASRDVVTRLTSVPMRGAEMLTISPCLSTAS